MPDPGPKRPHRLSEAAATHPAGTPGQQRHRRATTPESTPQHPQQTPVAPAPGLDSAPASHPSRRRRGAAMHSMTAQMVKCLGRGLPPSFDPRTAGDVGPESPREGPRDLLRPSAPPGGLNATAQLGTRMSRPFRYVCPSEGSRPSGGMHRSRLSVVRTTIDPGRAAGLQCPKSQTPRRAACLRLASAGCLLLVVWPCRRSGRVRRP